jgi:hypothetical protein
VKVLAELFELTFSHSIPDGIHKAIQSIR